MQWLKGLWKLEEDIANLEIDLERLKMKTPGDPSIRAIEGIIEFKKQTEIELGELVGTFNGLENKIMKMKYIDGLTLDNIAQRLGYSISHIGKIHADMMKEMKSNEVK